MAVWIYKNRWHFSHSVAILIELRWQSVSPLYESHVYKKGDNVSYTGLSTNGDKSLELM